jgi:hypothetical protein
MSIEAMKRALKVLEEKKLRTDEHLIPIIVDDLRQAIEAAEKQEPRNEHGFSNRIKTSRDICGND